MTPPGPPETSLLPSIQEILWEINEEILKIKKELIRLDKKQGGVTMGVKVMERLSNRKRRELLGRYIFGTKEAK